MFAWKKRLFVWEVCGLNSNKRRVLWFNSIRQRQYLKIGSQAGKRRSTNVYVKSAIVSNMVITSIYSPARKKMLKKNVGFTCFAKKKIVTNDIQRYAENFQKRSSTNLEKTVLFYIWLMQLLGLKQILPLKTNFLFLGLHHAKTKINDTYIKKKNYKLGHVNCQKSNT